MKQYKNEIRTVLTISLSILFMTLGCGKTKTIVVQHPSPEYRPPAKQGPPPWAPAHGYRAKYQYYYYPSSYVYFDTKKKLYFSAFSLSSLR